MELAEFVDAIWDGRLRVDEFHTGSAGEAEHMRTLRTAGWSTVAPDVGFWPARSDVSAIRTGEGVVLIDTGERVGADEMVAALRQWTSERVDTVIYSHGHPDHTGGADALDRAADARQVPRPRVVAHEAVLDRFVKYRRSAEYNAIVNRRQFQDPGITWPTEFRLPDRTYGRSGLTLDIGGVRFELHHARGETDDQTWTWLPERRVLCCGDFFMWVAPNAGNPHKSQRFAVDWALALREMAALGAVLLLPGHGYPIFGEDRIRAALTDVADYLQSLHDQTLDLMNQGATLDTVVHSVVPPAHLLERPYLRPLFDDPEFVVRNVWRFYGGWFGGDPAWLKPAPEAELSRELAQLAGGAARLAGRATELARAGNLRLACHLAQTAGLAAPQDRDVLLQRQSVFRQRAEQERSLMARSVYELAARDPIPGGQAQPAPRSSAS